jgi:EAL domain-containing protein (putative c-di-GMP-specific phosphodiesterase class I)
MHNYDLNRDFPDKKYQFTLNLSPRQLMDDKLVDEFGKLIRKYKMTTSKITLEISEYSTYEKNTVIKNNIDRLKKIGFKIAINGFGLDYSTLTSLETMPIDTIRLDKYFFDKEEDTNIKVKLTSLIVDTAKQYEKVVIAEGIETIEMLELVKKAGIELVQGYIYSKPLPVEDVSAFIKRRGWEAEYKEHLKPKVKSQEPLMGHPLAKQKEEAKGKVETEELVSNIEEEKIEEIEVNEDKKDEIEVTEEKNLSLDENKEEKEKDESLFDFDDDNFL